MAFVLRLALFLVFATSLIMIFAQSTSALPPDFFRPVSVARSQFIRIHRVYSSALLF